MTGTISRYFILLLIFTSITVLLFIPIMGPSLPLNIDCLTHVSDIVQARMALIEGQFPLRVAPLMQDDWRYPHFQFYSPSSYFLAGLIYRWLTPANPFAAYKIMMMLSLLLGGIYMYRLAFRFLKSAYAALIAACAFLLAPYFTIMINQMAAFNEVIALGMLPAVLYYTLIRFYYSSNKAWFQAALCWYFLATTHLVTFLLASFFIILFLLILTLQNRSQWRGFCYAILAYGFGCLLGFWYLAPVVLLSQYFMVSDSFANPASFYSYTPSFLNLISPLPMTSYGIHNWPGMVLSFSRIHPNAGTGILIGVGVSAWVCLKKYLSAEEKIHPFVPALLLLFSVTFFMVWTPFDFWQWLPQSFRFMQYSWRMLGQLAWMGALLCGWSIFWLFGNKLNAWQSVLIIVLLAINALAWLGLPVDKIEGPYNILQHVINNDDFLIDPVSHPDLIKNMDTMLIASSVFTENLALNNLRPLIIPVQYLDAAAAPQLVLHGSLPAGNPEVSLTPLLDGRPATSYLLKPGSFQVNVALPKPKKPLLISFNIQSSASKAPRILLDKILMNGFMKADRTMPVNSVLSHCRQNKDFTRCDLYVPASVHLLELPIFYYPDLLSVTLNGKKIPYENVFYENHLITGIVPQAGRMNSIEIHFRGLEWANIVSRICWCVAIIFLVVSGLRFLILNKNTLQINLK